MANTSKTSGLTEREIFYFRQRYKNRVFQAVAAFFAARAEGGLTKSELAARLGKDPAQVTRWFSGPGNWTLETVSDLLLAMNAEMSSEVLELDAKDPAASETSSRNDLRVITFSDQPEPGSSLEEVKIYA